MNSKKNQQYQRTEAHLREVLLDLLKQKPLEKITVREICELAQINRSTFYAHYEDIYDMARKSELEMAKGLGEHFRTTVDADNFLSLQVAERFFDYVQENREFYRYYLGHLDQNLIETGFDYIRKSFVTPYSQRFGLLSEKWIVYYSDVFLYGLVAVIRRWLENDCRESPIEMARCILNAFPAPPEK